MFDYQQIFNVDKAGFFFAWAGHANKDDFQLKVAGFIQL